MTTRSFFSWLKGSKTPRRDARSRQTTRRFVPRVEALEAREVPAALSIVNAINAADQLHPTPAEDANDPNNPAILLPGANVVWTYLVTNQGQSPLTINAVRDDAGTPGTTADDFNPTYVSGDTNANGKLDFGETWLYTSAGVRNYQVQTGLYVNIATATATDTNSQTVSASDPNYHFGTNGNEAPTLALPAAQTAFEDVDKTISGIVVGDPDGGTQSVTLSVGHGTLSLGTTTGLTVSGNGSGAVTLMGSIENLNAALADLDYRGNLNYSGVDTLSISVSDGSLNASGSVAITVKSWAQQAADLNAQVDALVAAGVLNKGRGKALTLNLKDNNGDAGKVKAFLNQVRAFLQSGILTQAQADSLLVPGNILLLSVRRR